MIFITVITAPLPARWNIYSGAEYNRELWRRFLTWNITRKAKNNQVDRTTPTTPCELARARRVHKLDIKGYYLVRCTTDTHSIWCVDVAIAARYSDHPPARTDTQRRGRENICTHFGSTGFSTCGLRSFFLLSSFFFFLFSFFPRFFPLLSSFYFFPFFFLLKALLPPRSIRFLLRSTLHIECPRFGFFFLFSSTRLQIPRWQMFALKRDFI